MKSQFLQILISTFDDIDNHISISNIFIYFIMLLLTDMLYYIQGLVVLIFIYQSILFHSMWKY